MLNLGSQGAKRTRNEANHLGINFGSWFEGLRRNSKEKFGNEIILNNQSEYSILPPARFGHQTVRDFRLEHHHRQINDVDITGEMLKNWRGNGIRKIAHNPEAVRGTELAKLAKIHSQNVSIEEFYPRDTISLLQPRAKNRVQLHPDVAALVNQMPGQGTRATSNLQNRVAKFQAEASHDPLCQRGSVQEMLSQSLFGSYGFLLHLAVRTCILACLGFTDRSHSTHWPAASEQNVHSILLQGR